LYRSLRPVALAALCGLTPAGASAAPADPATIATRVLADQGVRGVVVLRTSDGKLHTSDPKRARRGFLPASTFKIPNSLIALETGAIPDESTVLKWDGRDRGSEGWNADQDMRTALRRSTVWFYQELARRVGAERMHDWLKRLAYGNRKATPRIDSFWLNGDLRITPNEQIEFLERLQRGKLPVSERSLRIVREILIVDRGPGWVLRAKTGSTGQPGIGWYVGWVERDDGAAYTVAVNLDLAADEDRAKRESVARAVLAELGAFR
jgi:beta-lactamase class D